MKQFKRILLYAGTGDFQAAITRSVQLALENQATLTLMDVVPPWPRKTAALGTHLMTPEELERQIIEERREKLLQMASEYSATGVPIDVTIGIGKPADEIVRQVIRGSHDLVVKTADGTSPVARLFGSVMISLLRTCPCPVWALKPEAHGEFDTVLAAIDPEAEDAEHANLNRTILELSLAIARRENAALHLVGAWDLWMESALRQHAGDEEVDTMVVSRERELHESFEQMLQPHVQPTDRVQIHIRRGTPAKTIRAMADQVEADLMVMGTVCRTGVAGVLIGNTAEQLLSDVNCSVLAIKPEGFVSPIELPGDEPEDEGKSSDLPLI